MTRKRKVGGKDKPRKEDVIFASKCGHAHTECTLLNDAIMARRTEYANGDDEEKEGIAKVSCSHLHLHSNHKHLLLI